MKYGVFSFSIEVSYTIRYASDKLCLEVSSRFLQTSTGRNEFIFFNFFLSKMNKWIFIFILYILILDIWQLGLDWKKIKAKISWNESYWLHNAVKGASSRSHLRKFSKSMFWVCLHWRFVAVRLMFLITLISLLLPYKDLNEFHMWPSIVESGQLHISCNNALIRKMQISRYSI